MDPTAPEAAGVAPAPQTEATPISNPAPAPAPAPTPAPDMHGFTSAELADMRKFYDANGGFDKVKSLVSNPRPAQAPQMPTSQPMPTQAPMPEPQQPAYTPPQGSITAQEFLAQQYFQGLAADPKYAGISEQVANGEVLREMAAFNITPLNQDGSLNDTMVRRFLDLKAQTVPAKGTGTEPDASAAPTVDYVQVAESGITSMEQAYAVLDQDMRLKAQGLAGHPAISSAEEYIKTGGKSKK